MISEEIHVEKIHINEIDDLAIEQRSVIEEQAVKYPVNQVSTCSSENHRKSKPKGECFAAHFIQVQQDADARKDGENGKKQLASNIDPECHSGVFNVCQPDEIPQDLLATPERKTP